MDTPVLGNLQVQLVHQPADGLIHINNYNICSRADDLSDWYGNTNQWLQIAR